MTDGKNEGNNKMEQDKVMAEGRAYAAHLRDAGRLVYTGEFTERRAAEAYRAGYYAAVGEVMEKVKHLQNQRIIMEYLREVMSHE